jgi:hypothetical protein
MTYSADFERGNPDYVETSPSASSAHQSDHTFEFWWKPESLVASEDQTFWESRHTLGGTPERLWKTDNAGSPRLRHYMQSIGGVGPTAAQLAEIEWDISAAVSVGVWVHLAIAIDISQATATQAELFVNGVSAGNGTIIQGTGITQVVLADNGYRIGQSWAGGDGIDGLLKDFRLWADLRSAGEISSNYQHFFMDSGAQAAMQIELWKAGQHHFNSTEVVTSAFNMYDWAVLSSSPPALVVDSPANWTSNIGDTNAREMAGGPGGAGAIGTELNLHDAVAREMPGGPAGLGILETEFNLHVAPGEVIATDSGAGLSGVKFRMRAFDSTLGRIVYWNAPDTDPNGTSYSGPGPISDVVVSEKNAD